MNDSINAKPPHTLKILLKVEFGVQAPRQYRYLITEKMATASSAVMSKDRALQRFSRIACLSITFSMKILSLSFYLAGLLVALVN